MLATFPNKTECGHSVSRRPQFRSEPFVKALSSGMFAMFLITLLGCDPPPTPIAETQAGKLCGRAYGSTVNSLQELYAQSGKQFPPLQSKADYIKRCVAFNFSTDQLRCLDPKLAIADHTCVETLEPVKAQAKKLSNKLLQPSPENSTP